MQTLLFKLLRPLFLSFFFLIYLHASVSSPIAIDLNSTTNGVLASESDTSPNSYNASEYYAFTLMEDKNISIGLESDLYYKIYLLDNYGNIIKEASKYDYKNNKIIVTLAQGSYKIDVTTIYDNQYGSFVLSFDENIIQTSTIALETILDGEWTDSSGISPGSMYHSNYYTFTLFERTDVAIDLQSNSPYLYLLDSNYNVITDSENSINGHAKIIKTLEAGVYTIDVTNDSYYDNIGTYTLRFKTNTILTTQIELNSTVEGTWNLSSGVSPLSKQYANYYTFVLDEDKDIVIEMGTSVSDAEIYLIDSNNTVITQSAYYKKFIITHLPAGTYTIDATQMSAHTGDFTIIVRENVIINEPIDLNSSIQGSWTRDSGLSENTGGYTNNYTFSLDDKKDIIITLSGENTYFYILDENGSRINNYMYFSETMVNTLEAGTYMIEVTQHIKKEDTYQLTLHENIIKNETIVLNSTTEGEWENSDGLSPQTHSYVKRYTFTLEKKTDIVIDLNSSIASRRVFLLDGDTHEVIFNNVYSRIVSTLDAGTYMLDVTYDSYYGIDKNATGRFTLNLKENIIQKSPMVFGMPIFGEWTTNSGVSNNGQYINQYTFSLAEKTTVRITLISKYSKFIKLGWGNEYANDLDDLYVVKVLEKGTYTIDVGINEWNKPYQTGNYELLIVADIERASPIEHLKIESSNAYYSVISWRKGSCDTVGYKIYLNNKLVADIDASENTYTLNGLEPSSEYSYSVIAYNSAGESKAVSGNFKTKKDDYAWLIPVQYNILN